MKIRILAASCCSAVVLCLAGLTAAQYGTSTSQKPEATPVAQIAPDTVQKIGPELVKAYNFQPYATSLPDHLWMKVDDDHLQFLHFQKPVNAPNNMLAFVGDGIRGRFCAEDQPDAGKTGYVHFHSAAGHHQIKGIPGEGHGGSPGEEGYWLRHIAVAEFDMMGMHFKPGLAHLEFMATPVPKCGK